MAPAASAKGAIASMQTLQAPRAVGPAASVKAAPAAELGPRWVLKGYAINVDDASKSVAILVDGKLEVERPYSRCADFNDEIVCEYHGVWYGPGGALPASSGVGGAPTRPYISALMR